MKVLLCAAEVVPFAKVGGLADVMGSLPKALEKLDIEPIVVMPRYGCIDPEKWQLNQSPVAYDVTLDGETYQIGLWQGRLPESNVLAYFIENQALFGSRNEVYPYGQPELEIKSFRLLGQALFGFMEHTNYWPDVLHLHDWHTAPILAELENRRHDPRYAKMRSVITIHNLAYQGVFGDTNWLREGLRLANALTTVSPNYAREIQTPEFGEGLDELLRHRSKDLHGILNGIDMDLLNPQNDKFIPRQYGPKDFAEGKAFCKAAIQEELGLPADVAKPVIGFVSRLVDQKGLDIMLPAMREVQNRLGDAVQWAILGTGDPRYEDQLKTLNGEFANIRTFIGFNLALAQKIYAGSDMFVMPSAFEPCGLGQMMALRYGSVPVVRHVGGLADTVFDIRQDAHQGNGFVFHDYTPEAFAQALINAVTLYQTDKDAWHQLVLRGMSEDFGWQRSARAYQTLYQSLVASPVS